jgi:RNA polymerase sporulation-specific sigma factor
MDEILELVNLAQANNERAITQLFEKYNALILSMSKKYLDMCFQKVRDDDDFVQEAKIAFYTAIMTYSNEKNVTFGAYAKVCIRNRLVSLLRTINSKKRRKIKNVQDSYSNSSQDYLIKQELEKKLFFLAENCLSPYEKKVFDCYINSQTIDEIAKKTGKSKK